MAMNLQAPDIRELKPRITVFGVGGAGGNAVNNMIEAGLDVTFIEQWPAHVEAMRTDGLRVHVDGRVQRVRPRALHLCDVATLREEFDIVLLVMKAYDADWATRLIAPRLAPDGAIAVVQNGMTTGVVQAAVGAERTVGAVIEISSTMTEPGIVHRHVPPSRSWFAVDAAAPRTADVTRILQHSGEVQPFDDIESAKWMKLVSNVSVLVPTAALGLPELADDPRFVTNPARVAHRDDLCALLIPALKAHGADHWYARLSAVGVPAGPINDLSEAFAFARGLGIEATVAVPGSPAPQVANPVTMSATPVSYRCGPPPLGGCATDEKP